MWVAAARIWLAFYEEAAAAAAAAVAVQTDKMFAGSRFMKLPLNEENGTKQLAEPLIEEKHRKNGIGQFHPQPSCDTNCIGFDAPLLAIGMPVPMLWSRLCLQVEPELVQS